MVNTKFPLKRFFIETEPEITQLSKSPNLLEKEKDVYIYYPNSIKAEILGWIDQDDVYIRRNKKIDLLS